MYGPKGNGDNAQELTYYEANQKLKRQVKEVEKTSGGSTAGRFGSNG